MSKKPSKIETILAALVRGEKLHRYTAWDYRDSCLHSTISALQNNHGIPISRKGITVVRQGDKVPVKLYWLSPTSLGRANEVLARMRQRRGLGAPNEG